MCRMLAASDWWVFFLFSCPTRQPIRFFRQTLMPFSKWVFSFGRLMNSSASTHSRATAAVTPSSNSIGNGTE